MTQNLFVVKSGDSAEEAIEHLKSIYDDSESENTEKPSPKIGTDEYWDEYWPIINKINSCHAFALTGGQAVIIREYQKDGQPRVGYMRPDHFKLAWGDRFLNYRDISGTERAKPWGEVWLRCQHKRKFEDIVFKPAPPGKKGHKRSEYNLWRGWPVKPSGRGSCDLFLEMVKNVICGGSKEQYEYLLSWMAHAVQRPQERPEVAVVLLGGKGIGKSFFADTFSRLFGHHGKKVVNPKHVTGQFNEHLQDCMVLFIDEAINAKNMKQDLGIINDVITAKTITIEAKYQNKIEVESYLRVIFASNQTWVVDASPDERRYFVPDISEHRKQDTKYFKAIHEQMFKNGGLENLLSRLEALPIEDFEPRHVPMTKALGGQKRESMKVEERLLEKILMDGELVVGGSWGLVPTENLHRKYLTMCAGRVSHPLDKAGLGRFLRKAIPSVRTTKPTQAGLAKKGILVKGKPESQIPCFEFPPLEEARAEFARYMGIDFDWDGEDMSRLLS